MRNCYKSNDLFTTAVLVFFSLYFLLKIVLITAYTYSVYLLNKYASEPSEFIRQDIVSLLDFNNSMTRYNIVIFILCAISFSFMDIQGE